MKNKKKKCEGTGKAKGNGCNELKYIHRYGLCINCFGKWLYSTTEGKEMLYKAAIRAKKDNIKKEQKRIREAKKENNEKNAMSLADTYFSRYIRLKHSERGKCTCYTCGTIKPIKEVDNGHYMKRGHKSTRFHENNCRPQCKVCNGNTLHNGKQVEFRINLINEIGLKEVEEIEKLSKESIKAGYHFYKEISDKYRVKVNELQKELNLKIW